MDMIVLGPFSDCEREAVVAARQVGQLKSEPGRKYGASGNRRRRVPAGEICAVAEQILAMLVAKHETDDRSRQIAMCAARDVQFHLVAAFHFGHGPAVSPAKI